MGFRWGGEGCAEHGDAGPARRWVTLILLPVSLLLVAVGDGAAQQDTVPKQPERKVRISGYPYIFSTPEAGPAAGVGGIVTFYTSRTDSVLRPSKVSVGGWYSLNGQYKISLTPVVYLNRNQWQLSMPADYGRFTDRFWGIGNQTEEFPDDTTAGAPDAQYEMSATNLKLDIQFPPFTPLGEGLLTRVGIVVEFNGTQILDVLDNPLIDSTLLGYAGGQTLGAGISYVIDSRNHTFFPNSGGLYTVKVVGYPVMLMADYGYTRLEADLRKYFGRNTKESLAFQAYGSFMFGSPPFYALSALGGSSRMRGYFLGRYRDRHYLMAQAEYRKMFWWRLGFAAFAGVGEVFGSEGSEFRLNELQWSVGGGLRVLFSRAELINLRVDFGVGKNTTGLYFQLEEAF